MKYDEQRRKATNQKPYTQISYGNQVPAIAVNAILDASADAMAPCGTVYRPQLYSRLSHTARGHSVPCILVFTFVVDVSSFFQSGQGLPSHVIVRHHPAN